MEDLVQSLIDNINRDYSARSAISPIIRKLSVKIKDGSATYKDAMRYATEIGNIRSKTLKNRISSDSFPDGKIYYGTAKQILDDSLKTDYKKIQSICNVAQKNQNKKLKVGLGIIEEEIDEDNINNMANMMSNADSYDDYSKTLEIACATFAKTVVDRNMKANASFQNKIGLKIVIQRIAGANCCDWCSNLAGSFEIGKAPDEVWAHHNGCTCNVDYDRK